MVCDFLWDDLTFGKDEGKKREKFRKKKRKKNIIATKIHHLLVRTSRKEVRERALSLSPFLSLERVARFLFLGFSTRGNASFFPRFFFARARPRTARASEWWVDYPPKRTKKKRVKSSRRRGHARRVWPTRLERNARNECARTRFFYRWVSKRSRCVGGCRRPSKRRRRKKMMMTDDGRLRRITANESRRFWMTFFDLWMKQH